MKAPLIIIKTELNLILEAVNALITETDLELEKI